MEEQQAKSGALGNIENFVEGQMKAEIQGEVNFILNSSTPAQLRSFSGLLTQAGIDSQPGTLEKAAQQLGGYAWGKALGWLLGGAAAPVEWLMTYTHPEPNTPALLNQTQQAINNKLHNP